MPGSRRGAAVARHRSAVGGGGARTDGRTGGAQMVPAAAAVGALVPLVRRAVRLAVRLAPRLLTASGRLLVLLLWTLLVLLRLLAVLLRLLAVLLGRLQVAAGRAAPTVARAAAVTLRVCSLMAAEVLRLCVSAVPRGRPLLPVLVPLCAALWLEALPAVLVTVLAAHHLTAAVRSGSRPLGDLELDLELELGSRGSRDSASLRSLDPRTGSDEREGSAESSATTVQESRGSSASRHGSLT